MDDTAAESLLLADIHAVEVAAVDVPLLTAVLSPQKSPLLASESATLTLVVSNGSGQLVTVTSIAVTFPVGTTAKTLTASATGIGTSVPDGWNAAQTGNIFTLTPKTPSAAKVGPDGLVFDFTGIIVNGQPGTCTVTIHEDAASPSRPRAPRITEAKLTKFPPTFALGELKVSETPIVSGGSVVVTWNGSPATYLLSYDADGSGVPRRIQNPTSPYTALDLTAPLVAFTLTASVTVPGEDRPLVVQRHAVVQVSTARITFGLYPLQVPRNGVVKLTWDVTGSTSRVLNPGNHALPPKGYAYVVVPREQTFTLVATEVGTSRQVYDSRLIQVDATVGPTEPPILKRGEDGGPGRNGEDDPGGLKRKADGGPGGEGTMPDFSVDLGPLDTDWPPRKVTRIQVIGGSGGRGGSGGSIGPISLGRGGDGGRGSVGGSVTLRLDPTKPAQQLVIDVEPGRGGEGGYGDPGGSPGRAGTPTPVRFTEMPRQTR